MSEWEYQVVETKNFPSVEVLDEFGQDGWEMVGNPIKVSDGLMGEKFITYLKRPIPEPTAKPEMEPDLKGQFRSLTTLEVEAYNTIFSTRVSNSLQRYGVPPALLVNMPRDQILAIKTIGPAGTSEIIESRKRLWAYPGLDDLPWEEKGGKLT